MIRWKYVLPRLALVLVLWFAFRFGLDPLLRLAVVTSGESAVGAKVELASVRSLLRHGELELQDFCVANPRKPMRNLLESDQARLQIDLHSLLHKRLVINDGTVTGLRFDTLRETSGQLDTQPDNLPPTDDGNLANLLPWLESGKKFGADWIDGIGTRFKQDLSDQFETPRVVKELQDSWTKQYAELQSRIDAIVAQARQMKDDLREARKNPLRNLQRISQLQESLVEVQQELQAATQQLQQLPEKARQDRRAVMAAREHDEQLIREALVLEQLDGSKLSEYLLGPMVSERLKTVLGWVRMARAMAPSKSLQSELDSNHSRGVTVHFVGPRQLPKFLIRRLELSGSARLGGQPVELVGTLTHATNEPSLLSKPTQLHLQSGGALKFSVNIAIDRRQEVSRDEFHIACPRLLIPAQTLGKGPFAMRLSSGTAKFQADVSLDGDRIDGKIRLVQSSVHLRRSGEINSDASSMEFKLTELLEHSLQNIEHLDAHIRMVGTLEQPEWHLQSNLGPQLAHGINQAAKLLVQKRAAALLAANRQEADAQLAKLAQLRDRAQQQLLAKLGESEQMVGQLARLGGGGNLPFPQLSIPQQLDIQRK